MDYPRLKTILLHARGLSPSEREDWLQRECADDPELLAEARALLAHDTSPEPEVLTPSVAGHALRDAFEAASIPERVGPYRMLEQVGEGGMGVVYRARDEGPLEREVAVKFLRFGLASTSARARFDTERALLARMDHEGIARVYGAGTDEQGRPWVAMELVHGEPITRWCDAQRAPLELRVRLLRDLCLAMQHAHQKGVLHRDLKPSNLLVDLRDGEPRARVIDFGIAKGMDAAPAENLTIAGEFLGTPEYMSPEQTGEDPSLVDTRSDIYSLGVVLQELLVGDTPLGEETRRGRSLADLLVLLRERDASSPGKALSRLSRERQQEVAEARSLRRPEQLRRRIEGDLAAVVQKALEREPERRYESAAALAADLDRWLRGEPVEAAAPGPMRQLGSLARRHRLAFTAMATGLIVLLAGMTTTLWQAQRAGRERTRAEERLEDIRSFVIDLVFELDNGLRDLEGSNELRKLLAERCVDQLSRISEDRRARARLRVTLAGAYTRLSHLQKELGRLEDATAALAEAEQLLQEEFAERPDSLQVQRELAVNYDSQATLHTLVGEDQRSLELSQAALAIFEQLMEVDPTGPRRLRDLSQCRASVAGKLYGLGRPEESVEMRKLAIEGRRALAREAPDDVDAVRVLSREVRRLGNYYEDSGQLEQAGPYYEEALALDRRCVEMEPNNRRATIELGASLLNTGRYLCYVDRYDEGRPLLEESRVLRENQVHENPGELRYLSALAFTIASWGEIETDRGEIDLALAKFARADSFSIAGMAANPDINTFPQMSAWSRQLAARACLKDRRFDQAERFLRSAMEMVPVERTTGELVMAWRRASVQCDLGNVYFDRAGAEQGARRRDDLAQARNWFAVGLGRMRELDGEEKLMQWQLDEMEFMQDMDARADSTLAAMDR